MKKILLILCLASCVFAVAKITKPYTFTSGTPALASQVNGNFDSTITPTNLLIDTVNTKVPRWLHFSNHDSTFKWMNIDTVRGPVDIDTIIGGDTIAVNRLNAEKLDSVPDTLRATGIRGIRGVFSGNLNVGGNIVGDLTGNVTGNVTGSSGSCTGNAATATTFANVDSGVLACTLWVDTVTPWNVSRNLNAGTGTVGYYKVGPVIYIHFRDYKMTTYAGTIFGVFVGLNLGSKGYVAQGYANYHAVAIAVNGVAVPGYVSDQSTTELALYKSDLSSITTATGAGSGWQSAFLLLRCALW